MEFKIKPQDFKRLEQTHPDLFSMINHTVPNLSDEDKGKVAGLIIEYVIQSEGDVDIFQEIIDPQDEELDEEFKLN